MLWLLSGPVALLEAAASPLLMSQLREAGVLHSGGVLSDKGSLLAYGHKHSGSAFAILLRDAIKDPRDFCRYRIFIRSRKLDMTRQAKDEECEQEKRTSIVMKAENPQQFIKLLRDLRAVRQFRADAIPQEVIDTVLEVARWTGTASNRQHWELVVIRERKTLQALARCEGFAQHVAGAALGIVLVMAGEPGLVEQETYDEGRLSERIMLAAEAYGVGSCIGWLRGQGRTDAKKLLGISQERLVRTIISLGYPDEEARRARPKNANARKPLSELVHFERYS